MSEETNDGFVALTISVSEKDYAITTGLVDKLGEDIADHQRSFLYKVIRGLSALLRTDMARIGALGELSQMRDMADEMQEELLSQHETEEEGPQVEIVFEPDPELEERIRQHGLH